MLNASAGPWSLLRRRTVRPSCAARYRRRSANACPRRAADLEAALAPARRALAQISAVLKAPVCGDFAGPRGRTRAEDVFHTGNAAAADPRRFQQSEVPR
jgi:hypothetical protein